MRKRNPMAQDLRVNPRYRSRKGKSRRDLEQRTNRWSRAAKHKTPKSPGSAHGPGDGLSGVAASRHSTGTVGPQPGVLALVTMVV